MKNKLFLLLFLISFNLYAVNCKKVAVRFLPDGQDISLYAYEHHRFMPDGVVAEIASSEVGSITYEWLTPQVLYINLVRVEDAFRRRGIQTVLHEELIRKEHPKFVEFQLGDTNKARFLHGLRCVMSKIEVCESFEQNRLMEQMVSGMYKELSLEELKKAASYTPAYKTLVKLRYTLEDVNLNNYVGPNNTMFLKIDMRWSIESTTNI